MRLLANVSTSRTCYVHGEKNVSEIKPARVVGPASPGKNHSHSIVQEVDAPRAGLAPSASFRKHLAEWSQEEDGTQRQRR